MIVVFLVLAVVSALAGTVLGAWLAERTTVEVLRTELNGARANEQLLLTRLASRTPAEFHAITAPAAAPAPVADVRHVWDDTGLFEVEVPLGAEV